MQKTYMYTPELTGIKNKVNASHFTLTTKEGKSYKVPTSTLLKQFSNAVALESPVVSMKSGKQEFDCSILHVAIKLAVAIDCSGAKGAIRYHDTCFLAILLHPLRLRIVLPVYVYTRI